MGFFGKSGMTPKMNTLATCLTLLAVCNWGVGVGIADSQEQTRQTLPVRQTVGGNGEEGRQTAQGPDPSLLVRRAIAALEGHRSITAEIRQKVNLLDQELFGAGYYMERRGAGGLQFVLRSRIQADADQEPSSLLKVFDGRYLWTYRRLGGSESLGRIDVEYVKQRLEETGKIVELADVGKWPGLGGLPRLLRGLSIAFDFGTIEAESVRLKNGMPAWKVVGLWRPDQLRATAPGLEESTGPARVIEMDDLPSHLPGAVVLVLGQKDLFPYRIEFRRGRHGPPAAEDGDNEGVTLELSRVNIDGPTKPTWFVYNPGDLDYADQTRAFLKSLGVD